MRVEPTDESFAEIIKESNKPTIIVSPVAGEEAIAAGLSLKLMLENEGKSTRMICPRGISSVVASLPGGSAIDKAFPPRSLHLSFRLPGAIVKKVSYYISGDIVNFLIEPLSGSTDPKDLLVTHSPLETDLAIVLSFGTKAELIGVIGSDSVDVSLLPLVNIDNSGYNERYGQINIIDEEAKGVSEMVFSRLGTWGLHPTYKSAECLLFGLGLLER